MSMNETCRVSSYNCSQADRWHCFPSAGGCAERQDLVDEYSGPLVCGSVALRLAGGTGAGSSGNHGSSRAVALLYFPSLT